VKSRIKVTVVILVALAAASQSYAEIVNGVVIGPSTDGPSAESGGPQPAPVTVIDFDDLTAPCVFRDTTALRERYSASGVHFSGPGQDGGAILDMCGGFNVDARSGRNFLAFNRESAMSDGGLPADPEIIEFDLLMAYVSVYAAGGYNEDTFRMDAYDELGGLIDTATVTTQTWAELSVSSPAGISRIVLTQTGDEAFVYDDLSFQPIPEPTTLLLLAFGGIALYKKRN
jgi:hypothetical protein